MLLLGGAALQRCDHVASMRAASAAGPWESVSKREVVRAEVCFWVAQRFSAAIGCHMADGFSR